MQDPMSREAFAAYMKSLREAVGLRLRDIERMTDGAINNSYLSQIEHGKIRRPSLDFLHELAQIYRTSYVDLLARAGYPVPEGMGEQDADGFPSHLFAALHDEDKQALVEYAAFLRQRRDAN